MDIEELIDLVDLVDLGGIVLMGNEYLHNYIKYSNNNNLNYIVIELVMLIPGNIYAKLIKVKRYTFKY